MITTSMKFFKNKTNKAQKITIIAGYTLFALTVLSIIISTVYPFGSMLFNPLVRHWNVSVLLVALTAGAILPTLLAYVIGDGSVRSKSKTSHHFNGIMFGLLSYWLVDFVFVPVDILNAALSSSSTNLRVLVVNAAPIIAVVVITSILALAHVRGRYSKKDVIEYKPFQILLLAAILLPAIGNYVIEIANYGFSPYPTIQLAIIVVFGIISYLTLHKTKLSQALKLTWAAVSVSILHIALYVFMQLASGATIFVFHANFSNETYMVLNYIVSALAVLCWVVYWRMTVRGLVVKKAKRGIK